MGKETKQDQQQEPKPAPPSTKPDFDERHGGGDRLPLPERSGDMDPAGMEPAQDPR